MKENVVGTIMGSTVSCNGCGSDFTVAVSEEKLTRNRVGYYFKCTECGEKYPFASLTQKGIDLLGDLNRLKARMRKNPNPYLKKYNDLLRKYQREFTGPYQEREVLVSE